MTVRPVRLVALALLLATSLVSGCSKADGDTLSPSDATFAGLDGSVVREVLDSPIAQDRVAGDDQAVAAARYQGMVRNFIACRGALQAYRTWLDSGLAPALQKQPVPSFPAQTAVDMDRDIAVIQKDLDSGDISLLRDLLTNSRGCGSWIPAEPGDVSGPTIADTVNGKQ